MDVIRRFDPWGDSWCCCPEKYSLNPYTGCPHGCIYCYITAYVPRAFECRPKKDLLRRVERDLRGLGKGFISMSNSSDPYPPIEKELELTRGVLETLSRHRRPVLVVTKSDIVARDAELLAGMPAAVTVTVTTLTSDARILEPGAPSPRRRLRAMRELSEAGVPVGLRLDPIIPGVTGDAEEVISAAVESGALHVTASTFKPRNDGWNRFSEGFVEAAERLGPMYAAGSRRHGTSYLPENMRREILHRVKHIAQDHGLTFGACREGLDMGQTPGCDGSHLIARHAGDRL